MTQPLIVIADDHVDIVEALRLLLKAEGYRTVTAHVPEGVLALLEREQAYAALLDLNYTLDITSGREGLDLLSRIRALDPTLPVIVMTAWGSVDKAVEAMQLGARDFIEKPWDNARLLTTLRTQVELARALRISQRLEQENQILRRTGLPDLVAESPAMRPVLELMERVAPSDANILVTGEHGTGKEVVARYLHNLSSRAEGPFMSINCGALPENLLESELFGHVKGSFTGAVRDKQGLFAAARGGTFFLDEVGEMPPSLQVKLLRVLQEREVIPVGATEAIPVDVRIIAATNRDLEEEIRRGNFRSDLFYRLNVIALDLPPLRERRDDLLLLIESFLNQLGSESDSPPKALSSEALDAVMVYDWPGNVRELENALEHAVVLSRGNLIDASALPVRITTRRKEPLVAERSYRNPALEVIERAYIMWVLQAEGGNKTRAAEVLGIDPSTLYRKLSRYEEQQVAEA